MLKKVLPAIATIVAMLFYGAGCESGNPTSSTALTGLGDVLSTYAPSEIHVVGLTEITPLVRDRWTSNLKVYADLRDSFGCRIKSPGIFRFELYEFVPRSSQPTGKRMLIWSDIDLTDPVRNNDHWRDFLRAYQFDLDMNFRPKPDETFILEVTFTTPAGRRLSDLFQLKYEEK